MVFEKINKIKIKKNTSIKGVLKKFSLTAIHTEQKGFGIIIDASEKCIGVVTDGDIRSYLVKGGKIDDKIHLAMNKNYIAAYKNDSYHQILRYFDKGILNIPLLDKKNKVIDLLRYSKFRATYITDTRIIRARCPVRISFSGGGTDFSDYINSNLTSVFTSSINKYCTASILIRPDKKINIISKDLNFKYSAKNINSIKFGDKLDLIKSAIKVMAPDFGFDLETFADFRPGTGLGGSSAIAVAVIGALNYFRNENHFDLYRIADLAYQAERIDFGIKGGWQDYYATAFGGFNLLEFNKNEIIVNPIHFHDNILLELELNLMLFKLGKTRNSNKIQVKNIKSIKKFSKNFEPMHKLTDEMKKTLLKGNIKKFGDLLNESWTLKKKIGYSISNTKVDKLYNLAKKNGALGGKLLGAGETGYMIIYASPLYQKTIQQILEKNGASLDSFSFTKKGLEVWSTSR